MIPSSSLLAASLALIPAAVSACSPNIRADGIARRDHQARSTLPVKRASTDNWQDFATILDPAEECTAYSYAPVTAAKSEFPTIWNTAYILPTDTEALARFATINATLPSNISAHGTANGDFTSFTPTYIGTGDPDCWWTFNGCTSPKYHYLVERNVTDYITVPEPNTFGLGFDDGPNCTHNAFYNFLQEKNETATMFYIGSNVLDWPLQAQRGYNEGHEMCVHTWSHQYMTALSDEEVFAELWYTMKAIKLVVGVTPSCWRAPYGDVDDRVRTIAYGLGLQNIMWEYDTDDWKVGVDGITLAEVQQNYQDVFDRANNGTFNNKGVIVLTHEINNTTMQLFMDNYAALKAAFKYLTPIWTAYNVTDMYPETNGTVGETFAQYENEKGASLSNTATATVALVDPTASSIVTLTPSTASAAATSDSASASASSSSGTSSNKTSGGVSALPGGAFALVPMAVGALMGAFFAL